MTQDLDERIGVALREGAPPAHDPLFRLRVLERREQKRFRNHSLMILAAALAFVAIPLLAINAGAQALDATGVVFFGVVFTAGYFFYGAAVMRRLSRVRTASRKFLRGAASGFAGGVD